jgi:hypothetical protein
MLASLQTSLTAEQIASQISVEDCSTKLPSLQICIGLLAVAMVLPFASNNPAYKAYIHR